MPVATGELPGGNERQTRTGAIETYLESFGDAKYENTKGVVWEIPNGRMIGQTGLDMLMASVFYAQTDAALLLARSLEDETPVTVGGTSYQLKDIARKELTGLLHTFEVLYREEEALTRGQFPEWQRLSKGIKYCPNIFLP